MRFGHYLQVFLFGYREGLAFMSHLKNFVQDESGATAIEYAFIAALIGVAIVGGLTTVGTTVDGAFQSFATHLNNAQSGL